MFIPLYEEYILQNVFIYITLRQTCMIISVS